MNHVPMVVIFSREGIRKPSDLPSEASALPRKDAPMASGPRRQARRTTIVIPHRGEIVVVDHRRFAREECTFYSELPAPIPPFIDAAPVARTQRVRII